MCASRRNVRDVPAVRFFEEVVPAGGALVKARAPSRRSGGLEEYGIDDAAKRAIRSALKAAHARVPYLCPEAADDALPEAIYEAFQPETYAPGDVLQWQGDAADSFFVVESGDVEAVPRRRRSRISREKTKPVFD